jgi:alkanesulfonate monooxygenase SsuD/methylene tetrahydromethanopterin reductase-like flavin-dependent oxidoreductase (luciferase family)
MRLTFFHLMPYRPLDMAERHKHRAAWVVLPNALYDPNKGADEYQSYIDQLVYAEELGFDGLVLNEHHQNIYGLMPSPNIIAAALTQRTKRARLVVLGSLLPLYLNPLRIAEEYAMVDSMSGGRLIAGFAMGGGPEAFNYNIPQPQARDRYWEAIDLIHRCWTEDGPFRHDGPHYPLRYVNIWPKPRQLPHPPIWIPGALSLETMEGVAKRGYDYFLSSRTHGAATRLAAQRFAAIIKEHGGRFHPFRMGILLSVYVAETDEQAREEAREGVWYFLKNCLKGHLRKEGRPLTFGPGVPSTTIRSYEHFLKNAPPPGGKQLGDVESWDELDAGGSIIAGSPATVREKLWRLVEQAGVGNLLIQFHFGNMRADLAKKSMRLFATEVAPALRRDSAMLFARDYPELEAMRVAGAAQ